MDGQQEAPPTEQEVMSWEGAGLIPGCLCVLVQTLAALPDQDSFYDVTDCLEQLGMEAVVRKHMSNKGTEPDLKAQFSTYEVLVPMRCW